MDAFEIRGQVDECLSDFDALVAVQPASTDHQSVNDLNGDEQRARFLIWSSNIGVFAAEHASLDYRLRDSLEARSIMLDLLRSLKNHLQRAINTVTLTNNVGILPASVANSDIYLSSDELHQVSLSSVISSSAVSSSYQDSTTDDSLSISVDQDRTPYEQRLHGVEQAIDRLYRLSVAIRKPSIISQNKKAANFVIKDEDGNDVSEQFTNFALVWLTHQFPTSSSTIRDRLANAITLRRKRFLYRQSHQKKLSNKYILRPPTLSTRSEYPQELDAESTVVARTIVQNSVSESPKRQHAVYTTKLPSQTSASKISAKFKSEDIFQPSSSRASTVFSMSLTHGFTIPIPDPPKPAPGSKEFECPYCCMILPMKEAVPSQWRRHVLNDLEPYICVFEDCKDSHVLFRDRKTWLSHMQETHTKQWTCIAAGHRLCVFETEEAFENHIRIDHVDGFKESQLSWYKSRSQGPSGSVFSSCPLCGYEPTEEKIMLIASAKGLDPHHLDERNNLMSEDIAKHLALHLQSMSTKALPWQENVEEELSEKAGSQYADEGHASEDDRSSFLLIKTDSSLQFNDEPEDIDSLRQAGDDSGLTSHGSFSNPSDLYNDEWGFIRRPQYYGHDRDPVLQKFLRKLYLNFTSSTDGRAGPVVPIHMNPPTPLNKNFFGRDHALAMIKAELCPKNSIKPADGKGVSYPLTFAICAPGGMGKTQVAIQFAHLHRKDFDIILWVNAASTNEMAQGFQRIALLLDLVPETSVDANDLLYTREMVKRWLVNPRGRENDNERKPHKIASWLLIYDGIQDPDILNDYWPYDGPGSILITSRNPFSWTKSLPLQPFSSEEAISFLLRLTGRELSEVNKDSLLSVSKRLGGLPLALTQMASIIVMKQLSFKQFLDSYNEREGQRELLQFQIELKSLSYQHTVASVWAFENLKHGRQLLNVLSMIDPDSIPERILTSTMREINLPGYPKTVEEYERARGELLACSLVTGNKHEHKLSIHRLVQDVTRARMGHGEFRQTLVACVDLIASIWPFESFAWRHGIARWSSCEELFPHIASLKDLFPTVLASSGTSNDYHLARLLTDAGWYLHERGQPIESNLFNNMAQSICESLKLRLYEKTNNSYEHDVTHVELDYTLAEIYHNRGCTASEANDAIEAMKNFQIFHNMMQDKLGKRPQRTDMRLGIACNELGNAYMLEEDWVEGEKYFRRSINLLQELDDFEPVSISLPMVNLGYAFWLQGKLAEATEVLEKGVDERKARYGIDDRISFISGRFYHALGNVAYDQGFLEKSLNYHHKALLHYKSTLGNNHHRTASVFVKVAEHNMRAHQYDTAIALLDHALKVYSMSNIYVPEKTRALFKKSRALRCLHLLEESEKELQTCFRVYLELIEDKNTTLKRQQVPKGRPEDLIDGDFDNLVAFWSK